LKAIIWDTNKDGITTAEEYINVLKELGYTIKNSEGSISYDDLLKGMTDVGLSG